MFNRLIMIVKGRDQIVVSNPLDPLEHTATSAPAIDNDNDDEDDLESESNVEEDGEGEMVTWRLMFVLVVKV
ncbi:Hypothetical predicted protein [Octopus vulgaris]|uniref:Uncharacterized protein n=1 Tax=Octopus vulgaris TaxID=6645 RepID=A0AA36BHT0_OCTVU|nr:Hypothetical predicted protein [Octopus vulgaris]